MVHSGVPTVQRHGEALYRMAQVAGVHLVLDAPWGYALLQDLPRPALVITQCPSPLYLLDLLERDYEGLIAVTAGPEEVAQALRRVARGERLLQIPNLPQVGLTPREREVTRLVALGLSDEAIAQSLGISRRTVYNLITQARLKLGLEHRTQLALAYFGLPILIS